MKWIRLKIKLVSENAHDDPMLGGKLLEHLRYAGLIHYKEQGKTVEVEFPIPRGPKATTYIEQVTRRPASFGDEAETFSLSGSPLQAEAIGGPKMLRAFCNFGDDWESVELDTKSGYYRCSRHGAKLVREASEVDA